MTSSHAGTPQARAKIHTTLTDFEIALNIYTFCKVTECAHSAM